MRAYHRNGCFGVPFRVAVCQDTLIVKFEERKPIRVPLTDFRKLFKGKSLGRYRSWAASMHGFCHGVTKLESGARILGYKVCRTPFVAVFDGMDGCSPRYAAFVLDLLPNVTFGENSWRGDNHCMALSSFLEATE